MGSLRNKLGLKDFHIFSKAPPAQGRTLSESAAGCSMATELIMCQLENEVVSNLSRVTESVREAVPRLNRSNETLASTLKIVQTARLSSEEGYELLQSALAQGGPLVKEMQEMASELSIIVNRKKHEQ